MNDTMTRPTFGLHDSMGRFDVIRDLDLNTGAAIDHSGRKVVHVPPFTPLQTGTWYVIDRMDGRMLGFDRRDDARSAMLTLKERVVAWGDVDLATWTRDQDALVYDPSTVRPWDTAARIVRDMDATPEQVKAAALAASEIDVRIGQRDRPHSHGKATKLGAATGSAKNRGSKALVDAINGMADPMTTAQVLSIIQAEHEGAYDAIVPVESVTFKFEGVLTATIDGAEPGYMVTPATIRRSTDHTNVPKNVSDWLMGRYDADHARYLNEGLRSRPGKQVMARLGVVREGAFEGNDYLRVIKSSEYTRVDDADVLGMVKPPAGQSLSWAHWFGGDHERDTSFGQALVGDPFDVDGDTYFGGITLVNSEVGTASVQVYPFVFREACWNGLIYTISAGIHAKQKHHGAIDMDSLAASIQDAIQNGLAASKQLVYLMSALRSVKVSQTDQAKLITFLSKKHKVQPSQALAWSEAMTQEPGDTAFEVFQGLTRSAQQYSPDLRFRLESLAGDMLTPSPELAAGKVVDLWDRLNMTAVATVTEEEAHEYLYVRSSR